jgi:hypothetical protein
MSLQVASAAGDFVSGLKDKILDFIPSEVEVKKDKVSDSQVEPYPLLHLTHS